METIIELFTHSNTAREKAFAEVDEILRTKSDAVLENTANRKLGYVISQIYLDLAYQIKKL